MIGSESATREAIKKREQRLKKKIEGTQKGTKCLIENRDKRLDIRDKNIYLNNTEENELFSEYLELRTKLKCKNTERAIALLINELLKYGHEDRIQMLNNSIMNSWKSVYPIKDNNFKKHSVEPEWLDKEIEGDEVSDEIKEFARRVREKN